jgi:hypothetical protein
LIKTGAPIFHGAVSSLLGKFVLVAAKSYIFRTFAAVMSLVLIFGIALALLLLPVILSLIGPGRLNSDASKGLHSDESTQNKQDEHFEIDGTSLTLSLTERLDKADLEIKHNFLHRGKGLIKLYLMKQI